MRRSAERRERSMVSARDDEDGIGRRVHCNCVMVRRSSWLGRVCASRPALCMAASLVALGLGGKTAWADQCSNPCEVGDGDVSAPIKQVVELGTAEGVAALERIKRRSRHVHRWLRLRGYVELPIDFWALRGCLRVAREGRLAHVMWRIRVA